MKDMKTNRVPRKFSNDVWLLVKEIPNGVYPSHHILSETIRRCWHNYFETPTSPQLRESLGIDTIEAYSQARRLCPTSKTGATLEHIVECQHNADGVIELVENKPTITQKEIEDYIKIDYKAVYRHKILEPLEGSEASVYLPKQLHTKRISNMG
jgi:hypothetical protein